MPSIQSGSSCYSAYEDLGDGKILVHATSLIPNINQKIIVTTRMPACCKRYYEELMKESQKPAFKSASFCQAALHNEVVCFKGKDGYYSRIPTKYIGNQPAYDWAGRDLYECGKRNCFPVYFQRKDRTWHHFNQLNYFSNTGLQQSKQGANYNEVPEAGKRYNRRNPYAYTPATPHKNAYQGQKRNLSSERIMPEPDTHRKPRNVSVKNKLQKNISID